MKNSLSTHEDTRLSRFVLAMGMVGIMIGAGMALLVDLGNARFAPQIPVALAMLIGCAVSLFLLGIAPHCTIQRQAKLTISWHRTHTA